MHRLTSREPMEVEVEVSKTDGTNLLATACPTVNFKLKDPACTSHTLQVFDQQHTGYDFLGYYHTGKKFVTKDIGPAETLVLHKQRGLVGLFLLI